MKLTDALQAINGYPVPSKTIEAIILEAGGEVNANCDFSSVIYKRAKAKVCLWTANAPSISENGISYSLTDEERKQLRAIAYGLERELDEQLEHSIRYGYKGDSL